MNFGKIKNLAMKLLLVLFVFMGAHGVFAGSITISGLFNHSANYNGGDYDYQSYIPAHDEIYIGSIYTVNIGIDTIITGYKYINLGYKEYPSSSYWSWHSSSSSMVYMPTGEYNGPIFLYDGPNIRGTCYVKVSLTKPEVKDQGRSFKDVNVGQGDDVNVTNGNMYLSFNDLSVRGIGVPTEILRTYNSMSQYNGPFGYGWTFTYGKKLAIAANEVTFRDEYGALKNYTLNQDGTFSSPTGEYSTLTKLADNTYILTHNCPVKI